MNTSCIFCQRIRDADYDGHGSTGVVSFEPLNPVTPGHRLFVPVLHVEDAASSLIDTGATFEAAASWGRHVGEQFNLITSAGSAATQTVFHLYVHYVPRRPADGLLLPWSNQPAA